MSSTDKYKTRWYPWGIQRLVSTYSNRHWDKGGGGGSGSQNSKCQDLPKFQFSGGGGVLEVKSQSAKICLNFNFFGGGGGVLNQIPEQGVVRNLSTNFSLPLSGSLCITDSVSDTTLRMWRLIGFWLSQQFIMITKNNVKIE